MTKIRLCFIKMVLKIYLVLKGNMVGLKVMFVQSTHCNISYIVLFFKCYLHLNISLKVKYTLNSLKAVHLSIQPITNYFIISDKMIYGAFYDCSNVFDQCFISVLFFACTSQVQVPCNYINYKITSLSALYTIVKKLANR